MANNSDVWTTETTFYRNFLWATAKTFAFDISYATMREKNFYFAILFNIFQRFFVFLSSTYFFNISTAKGNAL